MYVSCLLLLLLLNLFLQVVYRKVIPATHCDDLIKNNKKRETDILLKVVLGNKEQERHCTALT